MPGVRDCFMCSVLLAVEADKYLLVSPNLGKCLANCLE